MDSLLHILSKSAADGAANQQSATLPDLVPPPAYTAHPSFSADMDEEEDDECEPSTNITINESTNIQGSSNLIALPHTDPARLVALVLGALNTSSARASKRGDVHLNINCGVTVVGDKNVVGAPAASLSRARAGITPRPSIIDDVASTEGKKRKADDEPEESPERKRVETNVPAV